MNNQKSACVIQYGSGALDPPTIQTCRFLKKQGYSVTLISSPTEDSISTKDVEIGLNVVRANGWKFSNRLPPMFRKLLRWIHFCWAVRSSIKETAPSLIVPIMFHGLASIPYSVLDRSNDIIVLQCIYDIPAYKALGRLDKRIFEEGINRLSLVDALWASDSYKLDAIRKLADLPSNQYICHNCPELEFLADYSRSASRLRIKQTLESEGHLLLENDIILVRAGGVGPFSGMDETLRAIRSSPAHVKLIIMGRPSAAYLTELKSLIEELDLKERVFVLDRPQKVVWNSVLASADYGHLIHVKPTDKINLEVFEKNSSLSNNGYFQFMAAAIPFMVLDDPRNRSLDGVEQFIDFIRQEELELRIKKVIYLLVENRNHFASRGAVAREFFLNTYNWERQFGSVYEAVVGQKNAN